MPQDISYLTEKRERLPKMLLDTKIHNVIKGGFSCVTGDGTQIQQ
jgi:hypothetical protein